MIQDAKILFVILFLILTSEFSFAHHAHFITNRSTSVPEAPDIVVKSANIHTETDGSLFYINSLNTSECCCCVNGICFHDENKDDCSLNKNMINVSCKSHCESSKPENNNLINQNVKIQNFYKTFVKAYYSNTKETENSLLTQQHPIKQNTPVYISIHSFLI